jgi:2'-hydroxyisoflavone reductase
MRLLVIGGTVFVGRAVVDVALARGHDVTIFHRGRTGGAVHDGVAHVHGDRATDLGRVAGVEWDAVIDTCGFDGPTAAAAAEALSDVGHYGFVSSVSVYRDWPSAPVDEDAAVKEEGSEDAYGAGKVAAERALAGVFGDRLAVTRPGLIVGPHENIGRLPFWLRRVARGGEVLAPGDPDEGRQWVDARDLAAFSLDLAEQGVGGTFDVVAPPGSFTMRELLETCRSVTGSDATFTWRPARAIVAAGIEPWTGLPLWLWDADEDCSFTWSLPAARARSAGLRTRPMTDTVADTWAWLQSGVEEEVAWRSEYAVGELDPERERAALAAAP